MNRILKFRMLDVKNNKFWINGAGWDLYSLFASYREQLSDTENFRLIQFTGLTDANGKEIYEGDILQYDWFDHKNCKDVIIWDEDATCFRCKNNDDGYYTLSSYVSGMGNDWKPGIKSIIVGNVFENPELLK